MTLLDDILEKLRVRLELSNEFKKHLELYGRERILKMYICREPIVKALELFLNGVTFGRFNREKKYDELFHVFLIFLLENGTFMILEKNARPELRVSDISKINKNQHLQVFVYDKDIKLDNFVLSAIEHMKGDFYRYDAITNNCQIFVTQCLLANGLYNTDDDMFINQPVSETIGKIPMLKQLMRKVTDFDAIKSQMMGGQGLEESDRYKKIVF